MNDKNKRRPKKGHSNKQTYKKYNENYDVNNSDESKKAHINPVNALSWYVRDNQMLLDTCRLPYNIPVGLPVGRVGNLDAIIQHVDEDYAIPGIAVMSVVPTIGNAKTSVDPVNVAFAGMYTHMRSTNSGRWDFFAPDVAMATLAADSLYYTVKYYQRAYNTLFMFHNANKYLPQALIEAQGIDYDDLKANASWFRSQLNQRIERINALKVPSELYLFARHEWMFENYYIEGPSEKDQIYMYRPAAYYVYSLSDEGPGQLLCHRYLAGATGTEGRMTAADMIERLDLMLNPIFDDEYFNIIGGYIAKTYEGKVMHLDLLNDYTKIGLIWSEDVLLQFKNAKPMQVRHGSAGHQSTSAGYYDGFFDIHQKNNGGTDIRLHLEVDTPNTGLDIYRNINSGHTGYPETSDERLWTTRTIINQWTKPVLLTSPRANVEPGENMINTRLIPTIKAEVDETETFGYKITDIQFATEWPIDFEVFTRSKNKATKEITLRKYQLHNVMEFNAANDDAYEVTSRILPTISVFKFLPELALCTRTENGVSNTVYQSEISYFEIDNYSYVKQDDINMIHETAILGMLRVPEIADSSL